MNEFCRERGDRCVHIHIRPAPGIAGAEMSKI